MTVDILDNLLQPEQQVRNMAGQPKSTIYYALIFGVCRVTI